DRAAAGGGEDSQSENAVAAKSRGTEAGDARGDEGDGGAGGESGGARAVAGVQLVGEGSDGGVLRGGVRPVRGVLPSAAVRTAGAGAGFDGAISGLNRGFGGADGGQHRDGDGAGFRAGRGRGGTDGGREEGIFPGVRDADGYAGDASVVRVPGELP